MGKETKIILLKIKVMSDKFIQGLSLAVDKKMITMSQAFELVRDMNNVESTKDTSIGFNQNR